MAISYSNTRSQTLTSRHVIITCAAFSQSNFRSQTLTSRHVFSWLAQHQLLESNIFRSSMKFIPLQSYLFLTHFIEFKILWKRLVLLEGREKSVRVDRLDGLQNNSVSLCRQVLFFTCVLSQKETVFFHCLSVTSNIKSALKCMTEE